MSYAKFTEYLSVMIDKETREYIRAEAQRRGVSEATVVRELLARGREAGL